VHIVGCTMGMYYDARTFEYQTVKFVVVKGRNESIFIDRNNSQATSFEVTVRHGKFDAEIGRDLSEMKHCDISRSLFTVGARTELNSC